MTKEVIGAFEKQGDTSEKKAEDIFIVCKFFNPVGNGTWYCYEYFPDDRIFMGFADLGMGPECSEAGTISLAELEEFKGMMGLGIERDLYFKSGKYTLKQIMDGKRP